MRSLLRSRAVAAILVAVGLSLVVFGFSRAWELDTVERHGVFAIGHVTEVSDQAVTVTYQRMQEDFSGVAYPEDPGDFDVGEAVRIKALQNAWSRVIIEGTENSAGFYLVWLGFGAAIAAIGSLWLLRLWKGTTTVATLPPIEYAGHRHGGA